MFMSQLLGERYKEKPADATIDSHVFLLRGGYIRSVGNGVFSLLPPAKRIVNKIERILREEMDAIGGQEVLFPVVLPAELWEESGRFASVGSELLRLKDRNGHDMVLGMTHEEAAVHLARSEARSHVDYPFMIYQIQTKFRDEPRARGGLIRVREFTMKDAYSFHTTQEDLERYYDEVYRAYERIFARVGLPEVVSVGSDSGMMGGKIAHEFMLLADCGEDSIVLCTACDYRANMEVASSVLAKHPLPEAATEEVSTPGIRDIDSLCAFFKTEGKRLCKAAVFTKEGSGQPVVVFLRGDLQVNEAKLRAAVGANVFPLADTEGTGLQFGFIGPVNLAANGAQVLFDKSLEGETCLIGGANKPDTHIRNISMPRDVKPAAFHDLSKVSEGDACPHCGAPLSIKRGVEVGNIFQLGTKYTASMNMTYTDQNSQSATPIMGCYGIGVGRLVSCIIEARHDQYGPIWPVSVAPWQVHICMLNSSLDDVRETGHRLYEELSRQFEVILDDRPVAAGVQFADADLLGVPVRLIVSSRNLEKGQVEIVTRDKSVKTAAAVADVAGVVKGLLEA